MPLHAELQEVMRLQGLLTDPRERVAAEARDDLDKLRASDYVSVQYAVATVLYGFDGKLPAFLDEVAIPQLVQNARDALEGRKIPDEVVADAGELFSATRSLRAWGILGALAGAHLDEAVRKEAERYALDGYARTLSGNS